MASIALAVPVIMSAGNIPQYQFSAGTDYYSPLRNGTHIYTLDGGQRASAIFANGSVTSDGQTALGFSIGFDFVYGGNVVNQFVPTTHGAVFFGKDYVRVNSSASLALKAGDHMGYETMVAGVVPAEEDTKYADISYLTTGEEGNRVCTIQFSEITLDESNPWTSVYGTYSLQMRLYEADNSIEFALDELSAPALDNKLFMGLRGWDSADGLFLKSDNMRANGCTVGSSTAPTSNDYESLVKWDCYNNPNIEPARLCYRFTPSTNTQLPTVGPSNLNVVQEDDNLKISCTKATGADATVILISEHPFTDADYPVDGATFPIKTYQKGDAFVTTFGNATALYYGKDSDISVTYPGVKSAVSYYVAAVSANGVPMYDKAHASIFTMSAANEPPTNVTIMPGKDELTISWSNPVETILAYTTERIPLEQQNYPYRTAGTFGQPAVDVAEGDEIEGGGKVAYVGSDQEVTIKVPKNEMIYFALWSKDGEIISSKYTSAYGITYTSLPYEPKLENYNYKLVPQGWNSTDGGISYRVLQRAGGEDALYAISENNEPVLESPLITLPAEAEISFEYALETAADADGITIGNPENGTVPGYFGANRLSDGDEEHCLWVAAGENRLGSVVKYDGKMQDTGELYVRGTSEFRPFTCKVTKLDNQRTRLRIGFKTTNTSELWIRNLKVTAPEGSEIEGVDGENISLVMAGKGFISVSADTEIYSIDGRKVASLHGPATIQLPAGIYIANGSKVLVK